MVLLQVGVHTRILARLGATTGQEEGAFPVLGAVPHQATSVTFTDTLLGSREVSESRYTLHTLHTFLTHELGIPGTETIICHHFIPYGIRHLNGINV